MVNAIDIKQLNLEELIGVVSLYPWFGAARKELGVRMASIGGWSPSQYADAALYLSSRVKMYEVMMSNSDRDCTDKDVATLIEGLLHGTEEPEVKEVNKAESIFVGVGDYFSQSQYKDVRRNEDNIFSSFASRDINYVENTGGDKLELYTETLAQIYLEQDYIEEAKQIYSKLILRYPEKSAYFASLIEKLDNQK